MRLGELFAVAREVRGLSLRELEKASGVSNALISQIKTGKVKDPSFRNVVAIAAALNLSLDRLALTKSANNPNVRAAKVSVDTIYSLSATGKCGVLGDPPTQLI